MSRLLKTTAITYIPADPGFPGFAGTPETITLGGASCTAGVKGGISSNIPTVSGFGIAAPNSGYFLDYADNPYAPTVEYYSGVGIGTEVSANAKNGIPEGKCGPVGLLSVPIYDAQGRIKEIAYYAQYGCVPKTQSTSICTTYRVPAADRLPPIPARPPSPAQIIKSFQEGWNASAQSIRGLLPGKAVRFRIGFGTRGMLVGFNYEPWQPNINNMPIGIMFYDGQAKTYENGVFKESLGSFFQGQSFLIGRSKDNKIVYMNETQGLTQIRYVNIAAPTTPVHVFAVAYYGGDTIY
jgi:hypothetical protein